MKFTANCKMFSNSIKAIRTAADGKNESPIFSHVLIEAGTFGVSLVAQNNSFQMRTVIDVETVDEPGNALIPESVLPMFMNTTHEYFVMESDGMCLANVLFGPGKKNKRKCHASVLPPDNYLAMDIDKPEHVCSIDASRLAQAIRLVSSAVSKESTNPVLTGIAIQFHDKVATIVGCSNVILSVAEVAVEGSMPDSTFVIPKLAMDTLISKVIGTSPTGNVELIFEGSLIGFCFGNYTLISRLLGTSYVEWSRIVPSISKDSSYFSVSCGDLFNCVSAAEHINGGAVVISLSSSEGDLLVRANCALCEFNDSVATIAQKGSYSFRMDSSVILNAIATFKDMTLHVYIPTSVKRMYVCPKMVSSAGSSIFQVWAPMG